MAKTKKSKKSGPGNHGAGKTIPGNQGAGKSLPVAGKEPRPMYGPANRPRPRRPALRRPDSFSHVYSCVSGKNIIKPKKVLYRTFKGRPVAFYWKRAASGKVYKVYLDREYAKNIVNKSGAFAHVQAS